MIIYDAISLGTTGLLYKGEREDRIDDMATRNKNLSKPEGISRKDKKRTLESWN